MKFCSCLTLFSAVAPADELLQPALTCFYAGQADALILALLQHTPDKL